MNWSKIKEKFPKVHDELKELQEQNKSTEGVFLINLYHEKKQVKKKFPFTISLQEIENSLTQ